MGSGMSSESHKKQAQEKQTGFLDKMEQDPTAKRQVHGEHLSGTVPANPIGTYMEASTGSGCKQTSKKPAACTNRGG